MTWVIGASTIFGYGVVISDVRVTFPDGEEMDVLQKAYPLGKFIVAGFAGSVELGFVLLENLRGFLRLPAGAKDCAWDPEWVGRNWSAEARRVYGSASRALQERGADILMVGISPDEDIGIPGWAQSYVCVLKCPTFDAEIIKGGNKVCSIGSGGYVEVYVKALEGLTKTYHPFMQLETQGRGGWARGMGLELSSVLKEHPVEGVSQHVQIFVIQRGRITSHEVRETVYEADGQVVEEKIPKVARGYPELVKIIRNRKKEATGVRC